MLLHHHLLNDPLDCPREPAVPCTVLLATGGAAKEVLCPLLGHCSLPKAARLLHALLKLVELLLQALDVSRARLAAVARLERRQVRLQRLLLARHRRPRDCCARRLCLRLGLRLGHRPGLRPAPRPWPPPLGGLAAGAAVRLLRRVKRGDAAQAGDGPAAGGGAQCAARTQGRAEAALQQGGARPGHAADLAREEEEEVDRRRRILHLQVSEDRRLLRHDGLLLPRDAQRGERLIEEGDEQVEEDEEGEQKEDNQQQLREELDGVARVGGQAGLEVSKEAPDGDEEGASRREVEVGHEGRGLDEVEVVLGELIVGQEDEEREAKADEDHGEWREEVEDVGKHLAQRHQIEASRAVGGGGEGELEERPEGGGDEQHRVEGAQEVVGAKALSVDAAREPARGVASKVVDA